MKFSVGVSKKRKVLQKSASGSSYHSQYYFWLWSVCFGGCLGSIAQLGILRGCAVAHEGAQSRPVLYVTLHASCILVRIW